ncbi:MAG: polysaccharide pyruvyl transferase family protein [Polymorphobacter sp.]|uniref:polysaccharide pyruvyl transferase family protein n=1 Tax=Polymorphobacter sp. TaxID=1909290 RepID=UPI003A84C882
MCRDRFGVSAQWVVDPTFLLDIGDYDRLIAAADAGRGDDYILTYVLDFAEDKARAATMVGETLQMPVWSIKPHLPISQVPRRQHNSCRLVSVESWLRAFRNARFVVTDSFHGAVFSIIFNVPFIAVGNTARGMARFELLLEQFGLKERLVVDTSALTSALIATEIDWPKVNQRRQALAAEGRAFLARHLSDIS